MDVAIRCGDIESLAEQIECNPTKYLKEQWPLFYAAQRLNNAITRMRHGA